MRFADTIVFEDLSMTLEPGQRLGIQGPSGCGKTTLLRIIAGLEKPTGGQVIINGRVASSQDCLLSPAGRGIAMVTQNGALWPHMTIAENVLFGLWRLKRHAARERAFALLEAAGVAAVAQRYPHEISVGQARRVAVARALAPSSPFLLLDEPLTNLDEDSRQAVARLIRQELDGSGAALVLVTHNAEELDLLVEQAFSLHQYPEQNLHNISSMI